MKQPCGCCEGIEEITPQSRANRPGLKMLVYRIGTHATFLETMKARLSSHQLEITTDETGETRTIRPLRDLTTRNADDPAIALLDAWAMVGDVLTFYQERIANEGYLRTATERRSVLEIARLVGYKLRPGVAASVYLAFTLDPGSRSEIPKSTRAQSVPEAGELPQSFETSDIIEAREEWNILQVRLHRPHYITISDVSTKYSARSIPTIYFKGISTNLKLNDRIIFVFGNGEGQQVIRQVLEVTADAKADQTRVDFIATVSGTATQLPTAWTLALNSSRVKVARHLDMELFGVSPENPIAIRAAALLERLQKEFGKTDTTGKAMSEFIKSAILPGIETERQQAHNHNAEVLASWLDSAANDLQLIATMLSVFTSTEDETDTGRKVVEPITGLDQLLGSNLLEKPPSQPPLNALRLSRSLQQALLPAGAASKVPPDSYSPATDMGAQIVAAFNPKLKEPLYAAWKNANVTKPSELISVEPFRIKTTPFGSISQPEPWFDRSGNIVGYVEWNIRVEGAPPDNPPPPVITIFLPENSKPLPRPVNILKRNVIALDSIYDQIKPGSWVIIERPPREQVASEPGKRPNTIVAQVTKVETVAKADFSISAKVTQLTLSANWLDPEDTSFFVIRNTTVYAQSEPLELADEPVGEPVCGNNVELDRLYDGLKSGRWLIVSGERADIPNTDGVQASELVMLAGVTQDIHRIKLNADTTGKEVFQELLGDRAHTFLQFDKDLAYCYKRETVKIYGNVAEATHGETRAEVLGSGDGARALQSFDLKQSPLTFIAAPTPAGAESTLSVRVNDVLWHEADSLSELKATDRSYITRTDDESKTTVVFGNGKQGARLPTGVDNVRAVYRSGIGKPGNAKANQITLLQTRPLGVKSVANPMPATGGADRESRDQARRNAPLAVTALDRLVSVQDYADFARTFAGIGKAMASRISDGRRQLVHLTIAGADDIAIDVDSALYRNLVQALYDFGDAHQAFQVDVRELVIIFISANVRIMDDYIWESVEPKMRAKLLDTFSFERRELGQDVLLSEVTSAIQSVEGVAYTDVDTLVGVPEKVPDAQTGDRRTRSPEEIALAVKQALDIRAGKGPLPRIPVSLIAASEGAIRPAQIAYLTPVVPDTLILTELKK